jgi:hypothetical protein
MPPKSKLAKKNQVKKDQDIPLAVDRVDDQDDLITSVSKQQQQDDDDDEITPVNDNKKAIEEDDDLITSVSDDKKQVEEDDDLIISVCEMKNQDDDLVSNGTDVNDPIQQDSSVPVTEPMTTKETSIINSAKSEFANLTSKINPFTQKLGKGLYQVRQVCLYKLSDIFIIIIINNKQK